MTSMLERLFSSRVRVKLLTIFLLNADSRFYTRQLERLLDASPRSVQRELHNLEAIGLLRSQGKGNIKYYTVNREHPIYPELKRIVIKTAGLGDVLRRELANLGTVEQAFIYGSLAADDEDIWSDIDLMVIGQVDLIQLAPVVSRLEEALGREVSYVVYGREEAATKLRQGDPFLSNVWADPKVMLIGREDDLLRIGTPGQDQALSGQGSGNPSGHFK